MGLNDTLDRLKAERDTHLQWTEKRIYGPSIANLAERIFFARMLKDINPGMGEPKIDEMIDRSVMIATKLFNKLYK